MRRPIILLLAVAAVFTACKSAPQVRPAPPPKPAPPPPPAMDLSELTTQSQTLLGATLTLGGKLGHGISARDLAWVAKSGTNQVLGQGTETLTPDQDGSFSVDLPVTLASSLADVNKYANQDTIDIVVYATLGGKIQNQRAITIRTPKVPVATVQTVQAQKTGPSTIGIDIFVSIKNPNLFDVAMSAFNYKALVDGKTIATSSMPGGSIPASASTEFEISALEANGTNCGDDIREIMRKPNLDWGLDGAMEFGTLDIPYQLNGSMGLSAD